MTNKNTRGKLLITGSTGFVGFYLVREALKHGYQVFAGVRKSSKRSIFENMNVSFFEYDFSNPTELSQKLKEEKFDYIIHNIGLIAASNLKQLREVNKNTLVLLIEALRTAGSIPKKLILTSSLAAYGPADFQKGDQIDEFSIPHPVTNYGKSKLEAEEYLKKQNDIPHIIFRPTAVYGPRDTEFLPVYKMIKNRLELLIGKGEQYLTFIYIDDLATIFIQSLEKNILNKSYFLSDGNIYTAHEYYQTIAEHLDVKPYKIRLPIFILFIFAFISQKIGQLKGEYPVLNLDKINELKSRSWACNMDAIKKDFNFAPSYTITKGLKETILWCKSQKLL